METVGKLLQDCHIGVIEPEKFRKMVAERAYYKAEKRGFAVGYDMQDWLEAEREVRDQCVYWLLEIK